MRGNAGPARRAAGRRPAAAAVGPWPRTPLGLAARTHADPTERSCVGPALCRAPARLPRRFCKWWCVWGGGVGTLAALLLCGAGGAPTDPPAGRPGNSGRPAGPPRSARPARLQAPPAVRGSASSAGRARGRSRERERGRGEKARGRGSERAGEREGEGARAGSELRGVLPLSDDTNYQSKDRFCAIGLSST